MSESSPAAPDLNEVISGYDFVHSGEFLQGLLGKNPIELGLKNNQQFYCFDFDTRRSRANEVIEFLRGVCAGAQLKIVSIDSSPEITWDGEVLKNPHQTKALITFEKVDA